MKLFYCPECHQLVDIIRRGTGVHKCHCGKNAGKYLDDNLTGVFTHGAIVVGIDNNTWLPAVQRFKQHNPFGTDPWKQDGQYVRIDFFFTGWIPTIPGEIITVDTVKEVKKFPVDRVSPWKTSTMPNSPNHGAPKICNKQVCYCDNKGVCKNQ